MNSLKKISIFTLTIAFCGLSPLPAKTIEVAIEQTLNLLLQEEDTDHDQKITVDDYPVENTDRGDKRFVLNATDNKNYEINGTYYLANLLQELILQKESGNKKARISSERIFENPVHRFSRMIKNYYWDALTRRVDAQHITEALEDSKIPQSKIKYLYVSHNDSFAFDYFTGISRRLTDIDLKVIRLPEVINPSDVEKLDDKHGLLPLALETSASGEISGVPFVVPGGRFNEMYGWDSYFEALGLIVDGKTRLAKAMVDNLIYEIEKYGKILNANRSYYLTRSQPPFLTSMGLAVYQQLPDTDASRQWLKKVLFAAIKEYHTVWMNEDHLTSTGLNRYYGTGTGIPPEVEPGHFDFILKPFAKKHHLTLSKFETLYKLGLIQEPELDLFFIHDRAVRESGHDTTFRWRLGNKDRCADFITVDLNSLLYKYELDIAYMIRIIFDNRIEGESAEDWYARAKKRKYLILQYLWNPQQQLFYDYYMPDGKQSEYISATTFYPLWACHPDDPETKILDDNLANAFIFKALATLESNGGILASAMISLKKYGIEGVKRQWDYPNGWPPHQMLIWVALGNYGYMAIADRLIYKWLYTITRNAVDYNGTIPEKFDVVRRSHAVFAEYGNVGTKFSYMTKEGFGWMNASYQVGLDLLSENWKKSLAELIPPEWIVFESR
jgi:alpha,alpha-trehalase